jgi:hypothetical protein
MSKTACADALIGRSLELCRSMDGQWHPRDSAPTTSSLDHAAPLCNLVLHTLNNTYNSFASHSNLHSLKRLIFLHCSLVVRLTFMLPAPT